ncbi:MAG: glycosyltransferase family 9 protein [Syntrophaceae bacterium]|nr:glycosyltransferase family 9 protein [Syntrophaceae bacterium]
MIQLGDIGDIVWTWPALAAIHGRFPAAEMSLLARKGRGGLLEANPLLREIIEVVQPRGGGIAVLSAHANFLASLRRRRFDMAVDLRGDERGALLAWSTRAPVRIALAYGRNDVPFWRNRMFTHLAAAPLPGKGPFRGPAEQSLDVLRPFGIDIEGDLPPFPVPPVIAERVDRLFREERMDMELPWVTISPYSRWTYKEWGQEKWIDLIRWFREHWGAGTAIVGSVEDRDKADELLRGGGDHIRNLAGRTSLAELAGVIARSVLHVGVDTGGPHLAAALGLPTVTIYGPSFGEAWAHPGPRHRTVFPDRDCVPCRKIGCDNSHRSECLEELGPEKVRKAAGDLIASLGLISRH